MHALFSILSSVSGIVSQQSEPLRFSVRGFGHALFYWEDDTMYCSQCGKEISDASKFCSNCGEPLPENAYVCIKCGVRVGENENNSSVNSNAKSKIAAGLLGIFLGCFGVHNFYLGFTGKAIAQLLITILSCGFLSFVSAIWGLIEGILILTGSINKDAQGNNLVD